MEDRLAKYNELYAVSRAARADVTLEFTGKRIVAVREFYRELCKSGLMAFATKSVTTTKSVWVTSTLTGEAVKVQSIPVGEATDDIVEDWYCNYVPLYKYDPLVVELWRIYLCRLPVSLDVGLFTAWAYARSGWRVKYRYNAPTVIDAIIDMQSDITPEQLEQVKTQYPWFF